jgi:hypothetical protein
LRPPLALRVTREAYQHLGKQPPAAGSGQPGLFE